jgi:mannose-1-phosphate guanylyltransferase
LKASTDIVLRTGTGLVMPGATVDPTAEITGGSCIGRGSTVAAGAHIDGSIIEAGAVIGAQASITNSFVAAGATVDKGAKIGSSFVTKGEILSIPQ